MVTVLAVLGVLLVLFVAGVAATRDDVALADAPPDAADLDLPAGELGADDVRRVRFGLTLRGYRMAEVDALLERLAAQLEERAEIEPARGDLVHERAEPSPAAASEPTGPAHAPVAAPPARSDDGA